MPNERLLKRDINGLGRQIEEQRKLAREIGPTTVGCNSHFKQVASSSFCETRSAKDSATWRPAGIWAQERKISTFIVGMALDMAK